MNENIIVIDEDHHQLESIRQILVASGFHSVKVESNPRMAVRLFEGGEIFDVALLEVNMSDLSGIELLEIIKRQSPFTECLMISVTDDVRGAVNSMKRGACDYLVKPISSEELVSAINHALERKRMNAQSDLSSKDTLLKLNNPAAFAPIVTRSNEIYRIKKEAELHAHSDVPVLITGESGTGKELLARAIHAASPRAKFPFTAVNMAALTDSLFESEFFGHTKGAFTGAEKDRAGFLELSRQGTLFLDEIGQLSPAIQGKLLRFLQDGKYVKVGTNKSLQTDIRIIAATNANLSRLMVTKRFRKDLYYRLKGGWLHLPPLKERKIDIPLLVPRFIKEFRHPAKSGDIEEDALSLLMNYNYPGNIRELKSIIQSAVNLSQGRPISVNHFAKPFVEQNRMKKVRNSPETGTFAPLEDIEKQYILKVYEAMQRNKLKTARVLGIVVNTLRRKLAKYGVD